MSTSMIDSAFVNSPDTHTHAIKELWEEYSRFNSLNRHLQPATTTTTTTITPMQHFTATSTLKDRHAANRHTQVVIPKRSASLANTEILMPLSTSTPSAKRTFSLPNNRLRSSMYPHQTPPPSLMPVNPDEVSDLIDLYKSV